MSQSESPAGGSLSQSSGPWLSHTRSDAPVADHVAEPALSPEEDGLEILDDDGSDEEDEQEYFALRAGVSMGRPSSAAAGRRAYQRPWTAGAQRKPTGETEPKKRPRPASAKPGVASRSGKGAKLSGGGGVPIKGKAQRQREKEQREQRREQGWNGRFGVSRDVNTYDATVRRAKAPLTYSLETSQRKKSNTVGLQGKLLPWLDPKKQIKRKPLVDGAPVIMRRKIY